MAEVTGVPSWSLSGIMKLTEPESDGPSKSTEVTAGGYGALVSSLTSSVTKPLNCWSTGKVLRSSTRFSPG